MNLSRSFKNVSLISFIAWYFICCMFLVAERGHAQQNSADESFSERIKQRRIERQQNKATPVSTDTTSKIDKPGDYTFSIVHDGLTRLYRVHVPEKYSATNPAPLLLSFHGGGGNMHYQASDRYYGQIAASEDKGFIAVFPNGYSALKSGKFATWAAGACCGSARDKHVDDVGFVKQIISNVSHQIAIDRKQIVATGMSNGGMLTYRLACELSDTFKAIAAVAGTDNTLHCTPKVPVSILHIHAKNDDRVLYNGGAGKKLRDASKVTEFTSVPATVEKWVKLNGCNPAPRRVLDRPGVFCDEYSQCQGNVHVQLCVTETGGHSWPGGSKIRANELPSQALSANELMWDFFTRH